MGMRLVSGGTSGVSFRPVSGNSSTIARHPLDPDPNKWHIVAHEQIGAFLVLKIRYPNCTNHEGNKILLYRGVTISDIQEWDYLDPHFLEGCVSPIARFSPTDEGWQDAISFAKMKNA